MDEKLKKLSRVFRPQSVAIVGGSPVPNKIGNVLMKNFLDSRFMGKIYAVNPKYRDVLGVPCYPSVTKIPGPVDCVIVATPAETVPQIMEDCGKKKASGVIVLSGGFEEVGRQDLADAMKKTAERYKMPLIGPNCVERDARVLIKKKGMFGLEKIGDFVDEYFEKHSDKAIKMGDTFILDLVDCDEVAFVNSVSGNRNVFKRIKKVFKRRNATDIYEVFIAGKKKFRCSADHPFFIKSRDGWEKVDCKNLRGNERIPAINNICIDEENVSTLYLQENIEEFEGDIPPGLRFIKDGKVYEREGNIWKRKKEGMFSKDRENCFYWKHGHVAVPAKLGINDELCKLIGYFVADGNYGKDTMKIGYVDEEDAEKALRACATRVFLPFGPKKFYDRSETKEIKFGRKIGGFLFERLFGIPRYAENKRVPNFIFSTNGKNIISFLSGLFSGDGGAYQKGNKQTIYFFTTSENLQYEVLYLLNRIGIEGYAFTQKRTECSFKGKKYPARDLHGIRIDSIHYIQKLYSLGFRFLSNKKNSVLERIANKKPDKRQKARLKDEDICYKRIRSIKKVPERIDVFDFEVEETNNFIVNQIVTSNCLGIFDPYTRVDSVFLPMFKLQRPGPGDIAFITQSGAVGSTVLDLSAHYGMGVSKFISYGNGTVLDECDMLEFLENDKETKIIILYLEGVKDGKRLLEWMKRVNPKKPIVVLKAGKTGGAMAAARSHTGNLAGNYMAYKAAFRQAKVTEADGLDELFDFVKIFNQPLPKGRSVGVITNGGGMGVLTADAIEEQGLSLAEYSEESKAAIKQILPSYGNVGNPLDLVADSGVDAYKKAIDVMQNDPNIHSLAIIVLTQTPPIDERIIGVLTEASDDRRKPVVTISVGGDYTDNYRRALESRGVPSFGSPLSAIKALRRLVDYAQWHGKGKKGGALKGKTGIRGVER